MADCEGPAIDEYGFDGTTLNRDDNVALWRTTVEPLFQVEPAAADAHPDFATRMRSRPIGTGVLAEARSGAQQFRRDARTVATTGIDHVMVQLYRRGGYHGTTARGDIIVRPGDICVLDLNQTCATSADPFSTISLMIPRARLEAALPLVETVHGTVLRRETAVSQMVGLHLQSLATMLPQASADEGDALLDLSVGLSANALASQRSDPVMNEQPLFQRLCALVEGNLHDPQFDVAALAAQGGCSRTTLYRLFEETGGVAAFIRERRLRRALGDVLRGWPGVATIANRWGFAHPSSFTRAFVDRYGMTPREARSLGRANYSSGQQAVHGAEINWLRVWLLGN